MFIVCGKGGVGKSTISSALALKLSKKGYKVLLASIDPAHSLSDIMGVRINSEPTKVCDNLYAVEIDPYKEAEIYIEQSRKILESFIDRRTFSKFERFLENVKFSPSSLNTAYIKALSRYMNMDFDEIVIDTPPTGNLIYFVRSLFNLKDLLSFIVDLKTKEVNLKRNWKGEDVNDDILKRLKENLNDTLKVKESFQKANYIIIFNESPLSLNEVKLIKNELKSLGIRKFKFILNASNNDVSFSENYMKVPFMDEVSILQISEYLRGII